MKRFLLVCAALVGFWAGVVALAATMIQPYRFVPAGGAWVPTDEATLVRWIAADNLGGSLSDGDPISTATDQSGLSNNLTDAGANPFTYETNVVNGLPAIRPYVAGTSKLTGSVIASGGSVKTWAVVYAASSSPTAVMATTSGISNYTYFSGAGYHAEFRSSRADNYLASMPSSGVVVLIGVSSGSTYQIWVNGATDGAFGSAAFTAGDMFQLGNNGNDIAGWNTDIFEYLEFNVSADATLRSNIETYLARWQ